MVAPYYTNMVTKILRDLVAKGGTKAARGEAVQGLLLALFKNKNKMGAKIPSLFSGKEVRKIINLVDDVADAGTKKGVTRAISAQAKDTGKTMYEVAEASKKAFPYTDWWENFL
jgi:hypothetical protein